MSGERAAGAIVVGAGPNGLAAAAALAHAGVNVRLFEAKDAVGGGACTEELTLPGFRHDVCSALLPLALASPFFRGLPLAAEGLEYVFPPVDLAHPFDDGTAAVLERSIEGSAASLGEDAGTYERLMRPLVSSWPLIEADVLGPLRISRHALAFARFGLRASRSGRGWAGSFRGEKARALFGGLAAHAGLPLEAALTAGMALVLAIAAHRGGWPFVRGGSGRFSEALARHLGSLGVGIETGRRIGTVDSFPSDLAVLCDVTPRQLLSMTSRLPSSYRRRLSRFRYGVAAYKMDWALADAVPWTAAACRRAGTVHLGGTFEEIAAALRQANEGRAPERPFVITAQPSLFDPSRAPEGRHTLWAYAHVPRGSGERMAERIEDQIERFAPGFRRLVLARSVLDPQALERHDGNLIEGHIGGGSADWRQHFWRPSRSLYRTPVRGLYVCSSSTPPGGGVHGMCGYHAARAVLEDLFDTRGRRDDQSVQRLG